MYTVFTNPMIQPASTHIVYSNHFYQVNLIKRYK